MEKVLELAALGKVFEVMEGRVRDVCARMADGTLSPADLDRAIREVMLEGGEAVAREAVNELGRTARTSTGPRCPKCGKPMRFKQMRRMLLRTVMTGKPVRIVSPYWVCDSCRVGILGLREQLHLDRDGFTPGLREMCTRAGASEPFASASEENLLRMAGVTVSGTKVHTVCQETGAVAQELMEDGLLGEPRRLRPGEKLYVEIDGGMLFVDGEWKEAKLAILFPQSAIAEVSKNRREILHRQVLVTFGKPEDLGPMLWKAVERWLPKDKHGMPVVAGNVVVLADGSVWIWNLVEEYLPGARVVLDWYHMAEHVATAALANWPDNETQRKRWRTQIKNLLRRGRVDKALHDIGHLSMNRAPGSPAQEALASLFRYLDERRPLLGYKQARDEGLYIGSGVVESGMGFVLQQRMKRAGVRWTPTGACNMAALRCAYRSNGGFDAVFRRWRDSTTEIREAA
jgi:hypothetical protein